MTPALPYNFKFTQVNPQSDQLPPLPALQSYSVAVHKSGLWLIAGGLAGGMHEFGSGHHNLSPQTTSLYVIDPVNRLSFPVVLDSLPPELRDPLCATNQQSYYDCAADRFYIIGGYGKDNRSNLFTTFDSLLSFEVGPVIGIITQSDGSDAEKAARIAALITQSHDDDFAVTGGALMRMGGRFLLIFGQRFRGPLVTNITPDQQRYTEEIRVFNVDPATGAALNMSRIGTGPDDHSYHRRDLNVMPAIDPLTGTEMVAAFGGGFEWGKIAALRNPVWIDAWNSAWPDFHFEQTGNLLGCAVVPVFDANSKTMSLTFFGGIGMSPPVKGIPPDDGLPWTNQVNMVTYRRSSYFESEYQEINLPNAIPGNRFLGGGASFMIDPALFAAGQAHPNGVIKLESFAPGSRTLVGYIFGGIESSGPQEPTGTTATNALISVTLELP